MVTTHAPTFPTAETQIDILTQEGVEPERIVIGHTDTVKDARSTPIDLLKRGVYVEYDCMMAVKVGGADRRARAAPPRSSTCASWSSWATPSASCSPRTSASAPTRPRAAGPGLTFIFDEFAEAAIAAGVDAEVLRMISTENPRRALFGDE